ncbi:MAG: phosphatidylglycerophosphatase A [Kiritimatiellae bacterium]|nr:phosphatidylglycerophosphatase A [Kiritimatiellia bacterium]
MKRTFFDGLCLFVATGFGIGFVVPFAPGTFGSIPGVALAFATTRLDLWLQIVACLGFALAAIPFCGRAERLLGVVDDGRISADEWMLFPVAVIGIPLAELAWYWTLVFFVVVRIVDIVKPPPARRLQDLPGGLGVVADDFMANVYSLAINWAIYVAICSL